MTALNLAALRRANQERLPRFKNNNGVQAHSKPDGSDWSPMMWMIALMGEVGETADEIYNGGTIEKKGAELADIQIYLDILAQRIDDRDTSGNVNPNYTEVHLCELIRRVGALCELHKKFVRGDIVESAYAGKRREVMLRCYEAMGKVGSGSDKYVNVVDVSPGVDLAGAVIRKFNATSNKVQAGVFISPNEVITDGISFELPKLRNSDDTLDAAAGLKELPPIRIGKGGYDVLEAVAKERGVVLQELVRQALVKEIEQATGKAAPKEPSWSTGKDTWTVSSVPEGVVPVGFTQYDHSRAPEVGCYLAMYSDDLSKVRTLQYMDCFWSDDEGRLYRPPLYYKLRMPISLNG